MRASWWIASVLSIALGACGPADTRLSPGESPDAAPDAAPDGGPDAEVSRDPPDAAPDAPPEISPSLDPTIGFLGRELDVAVTADLSAGPPALDFGAGVEVVSLAVNGNVATAHLRIARDAAIGAHDVGITSAGRVVTLPQAFRVSPGLAVTTHGPLTQGSLLGVDLESLDPAENLGINPFGIGAELPRVPSFQGSFGETLVLIPPGLPPGPRQVEWLAAFQDRPPPLSAPDALVIAAREPEPLAPGSYTLPPIERFGTRLFRVHAPAGSVVSLLVQATGIDEPTMWVFGGSGRAADRLRVDATEIAFGQPLPSVWNEVPVLGDEDFYVVVHGHPRVLETRSDLGLVLRIQPAHVLEQDAAAHTTMETAQLAPECVEGCVLHGALPPHSVQVYAVPARGAFGWFLAGLRAGSDKVVFAGGPRLPDPRFIISQQPLARARAYDDPFFNTPFYLSVRNQDDVPHEYSVPVRWQHTEADQRPSL
jgi:hypothetical protein